MATTRYRKIYARSSLMHATWFHSSLKAKSAGSKRVLLGERLGDGKVIVEGTADKLVKQETQSTEKDSGNY